MGFELRREIRAVLPPGKLTPLERHLVLEIADQCSDKTREGFPGAALLALLIDKSERTVEETLKGVGKKWVELRVELGKGSDGRPYYSHRSKRTTFRFPQHAELQAAYEKATGIPWASSVSAGLPGAIRKKTTENPGASDRKPPTFPWKAPDFSVESPRESRGPFPQGTPHNYNTSPPSLLEDEGERQSMPVPQPRERRPKMTSQEKADAEGWRLLTVERDYSAAEATYLIGQLNDRHGIYSREWWRTANENDTLDDRIDEVKEDYRAAQASRQADDDDPLAATDDPRVA